MNYVGRTEVGDLEGERERLADRLDDREWLDGPGLLVVVDVRDVTEPHGDD